jgi:hypothetical protein
VHAKFSRHDLGVSEMLIRKKEFCIWVDFNVREEAAEFFYYPGGKVYFYVDDGVTRCKDWR